MPLLPHVDRPLLLVDDPFRDARPSVVLSLDTSEVAPVFAAFDAQERDAGDAGDLVDVGNGRPLLVPGTLSSAKRLLVFVTIIP